MLERGVAIDDGRGIHQNAVDPAGQRRLGKAGTNARGDLGDGNRAVKLSLASIGKFNYGHAGILPINKAGRRPSQGRRPTCRMVRASGIEPLTTTMSR